MLRNDELAAWDRQNFMHPYRLSNTPLDDECTSWPVWVGTYMVPKCSVFTRYPIVNH